MAGVQDSTVIDLVTHRPKTDQVILIMTEMRNWGSDGSLIKDLQAKFQTYLDFVEYGLLEEKFPSLAGKPVCIRLDCEYPPGDAEQEFLERVKTEWLAPLNIGFEIGLFGESS